MKKTVKKVIWIFVAAAISASLSACAVLRIDVDAYKGPLANHEEVQIEQMAVMAIGAKPLLIELRDTLEREGRKLKFREKSPYPEDFGPGSDNYTTGFMPYPGDEAAQNGKWLKDKRAIRVNGILGLYENQGPEQLNTISNEIERLLDKYTIARNELKTLKEGEEDFWKDYKEHLYVENKLGEATGNLVTEHPVYKKLDKPEDQNTFKQAYKLLSMEYPNLGNGGFRSERQDFTIQGFPVERVAAAHNKLKKLYEDNKDGNLKGCKYMKPFGAFPKMDENTSTNAFYALSIYDGKIVRTHLELLFANTECEKNSEKLGRAVDITVKLADAFVSLRVSTDGILTQMLKFITEVNTYPSVDMLPNHKELTIQAASVIQELVSDHKLGEASSEKNGESYKNSLNSNPVNSSLGLLDLHLTYQNDGDINGRQEDALQGPRIGISKYKDSDLPDSDTLTEELSEIIKISGSGLDRGRLSKGLNDLVDDFLLISEALQEEGGPEARQEREQKKEYTLARDTMVDALVRFAQKVLYVANNDHLLAKKTSGRSVDKTVQPYVQVLQAVGNSLLVQADDLRKRQGHAYKLKSRANMEIEAFNQSNVGNMAAYLKDLIESLESGKGELALRYAKIVKIRSAKADNVTKIEERKSTVERVKKQKELVEHLEGKYSMLSDLFILREWVKRESLILSNKVRNLNKHSNGGRELTDAQAGEIIQSAITMRDAFRGLDAQLEILSVEEEDYKIQLANAIACCQSRYKPDSAKKCNLEIDCEPLNELDNTFKALIQGGRGTQGSFWAAVAGTISTLESIPPLTKANAISTTATFTPYQTMINDVTNWNNTSSVKVAYTALTKVGHLSLQLDKLNEELRKNIESNQVEIKSLTAENNGYDEELKKISGYPDIETKARELGTALSVLGDKSIQTWACSKETTQKTRKEFVSVLCERLEGVAVGLNSAASSDNSKGSGTSSIKTVLTRENINIALKVVKSSGFDTAEFLLTGPKPEDPREVLDFLITSMQYEYLKEVKENSARTDKAQNLAQAIKAAYQYRSGMAYIRPSIPYLRSSTPATTLQGDMFPSGEHENLLIGNFLRSTPIVGNILQNEERIKRRLPEEFDKQFWHNINKVKVSGSGNTNYVIAKDDIGNWYVKNYSSDTSAITNSALNLAKFSLGPQMGLQLPVTSQSGNDLPGQQSGPFPTTGSKLYEKYTAEYVKQTKAQYDSALAMLDEDGLKEAVKSAWTAAGFGGNDKEKLEDMLNGAANDLETAHKEINNITETPQQAASVVMALRSALRLKRSLDIGIDGIEFDSVAKAQPAAESTKESLSPDATAAEIKAFQEAEEKKQEAEEKKQKAEEEKQEADNKELREKARKAADQAILAQLEDLSKKRTNTVDDYEQALKFIGDAINPE